MSDTVKLIIEIPKPMYEHIQNGTYCGTLYEELKNGIPLDNDSERAEVQAYFAGEAYGWEQGRKALIEDVKAEINQLPLVLFLGEDRIEKDSVMQILDNITNAESEETNMSKDEAIKILAAIRSDAIQGTCYVTESSAEALEMAIEALKNNYIGA